MSMASGFQLLRTVSARWNHALQPTSRAFVICGLIQTRQDFEIAGLDNRVEALEGVVGHYRYIIQTANATPRDGQLAFLKGDMSTTTRWGEATNIAVNPNALGGEVWPTDEVVTGDVLRFYLKGDITMEVSAFEAKVVQNNNNLFSIDTVVKEVGTIMDDSEYEVVHLSSFDPSGLATGLR